MKAVTNICIPPHSASHEALIPVCQELKIVKNAIIDKDIIIIDYDKMHTA